MLRAVALALRARLRELVRLREIFLIAQPPALAKEGNLLSLRLKGLVTFFRRLAATS